MPRKKTVKKTKKDFYTIDLELGGKIYRGIGETALEALQSLPQPEKIMNKGILTITNGDLKKVQLFYPVQLKRMFYNKTLQVIKAKQLLVGMK